jgi:hypothetical protein
MPVCEWIDYKGKRILFMDIGVTEKDVLKERIATIEPVVEKEPLNSILCICSVIGGKSSPEMTQMLKDFTKHNRPYMKMTAVIGVEGIQKIIYQGVLMFTGRKNLVLKNTRPEALEWLAEQ